MPIISAARPISGYVICTPVGSRVLDYPAGFVGNLAAADINSSKRATNRRRSGNTNRAGATYGNTVAKGVTVNGNLPVEVVVTSRLRSIR